MSPDPAALRSVNLTRTRSGAYTATNPRGGEVAVGDGSTADFTPVELLLTAVAACAAVDVDSLTSRLAEPTGFELRSSGHKVRDVLGNHLSEVEVVFHIRFPEGEQGDRARDRLPEAVSLSKDRLCTVSRTVALPTPVAFAVD